MCSSLRTWDCWADRGRLMSTMFGAPRRLECSTKRLWMRFAGEAGTIGIYMVMQSRCGRGM